MKLGLSNDPKGKQRQKGHQRLIQSSNAQPCQTRNVARRSCRPTPSQIAVVAMQCDNSAFQQRFHCGRLGITADLVVLSPARNQSEPSQTAGHASRLMTFHNQRRCVTRIGFIWIARGQINTKAFLNPLRSFGWREIGAHALNSEKRSPTGLTHHFQLRSSFLLCAAQSRK